MMLVMLFAFTFHVPIAPKKQELHAIGIGALLICYPEQALYACFFFTQFSHPKSGVVNEVLYQHPLGQLRFPNKPELDGFVLKCDFALWELMLHSAVVIIKERYFCVFLLRGNWDLILLFEVVQVGLRVSLSSCWVGLVSGQSKVDFRGKKQLETVIKDVILTLYCH